MHVRFAGAMYVSSCPPLEKMRSYVHISDVQPYDQGGSVSPAAGHDGSSAGGVHIAWEEEGGKGGCFGRR